MLNVAKVNLLELRSATHTSCSISGSAARTDVVKRERKSEKEKQGKEEQGLSMMLIKLVLLKKVLCLFFVFSFPSQWLGNLGSLV